MSRTIYCGYYPNKCNDNDILKYLDCNICNDDYSHLSIDFYNKCRELAEYNEESDCYIFTDITKLFSFAGSKDVPATMADYITNEYLENYIFIVWLR